jgi:hypothetical protein
LLLTTYQSVIRVVIEAADGGLSKRFLTDR